MHDKFFLVCFFQGSFHHIKVPLHVHRVQWELFASKLHLNGTGLLFLLLFATKVQEPAHTHKTQLHSR